MWRILSVIFAIIVAIGLGFFFVNQRRGAVSHKKTDVAPLNVDLQALKPAAWQPIEKRGLTKVSVDGDADVEWLFLYRDTGNTGQIGGLIYDAQSRPVGVNGVEAAQQAPAYLLPYRLMPDYTSHKSAGYLGDDAVSYQTVFAHADNNNEESVPDEAQVLIGDFLQIRGDYRGKTNRFSLFWWLDKQLGYGGALAYTPGWFSLSPQQPDDWSKWNGNDAGEHQFIDELWAWEPQSDRSNICRRIHWYLVGESEDNSLHFVADDENSDLTFCQGGTPAEPAFPEAQVLAYLSDGNEERWLEARTPEHYKNVSVRQLSIPVIDLNAQTVGVSVNFMADDGPHDTVWEVQMVPATSLQSSVHWRIAAFYNR